ncbi:MAG: type II toxin-antitoxin system RelE/ParE family toxin [Nanoarchaeota archaeon]|nr:type II toxin-antitoxin system RelE/ParE family toxin [DPANN group archaeon]MBL7116398.1 type II toxin-antitoxin system RelE/ParE family toxin [Nanoarchaeota archaeon]
MVKSVFTPRFKKTFSRIKDKSLKERIIKQVLKTKTTPEIGKPMKFERKNTRELYIKPFRLSYTYIKKENKLIFLDLYHKKEQ